MKKSIVEYQILTHPAPDFVGTTPLKRGHISGYNMKSLKNILFAGAVIALSILPQVLMK